MVSPSGRLGFEMEGTRKEEGVMNDIEEKINNIKWSWRITDEEVHERLCNTMEEPENE